MNDPNVPQSLEEIDPAVLAEIEAEFAGISAEITRISGLPKSDGPKKPQMLAALRKQWQEKSAARDPNRPEWRKSLDEALDRAIDKLIAESIIELPDGQMAFEMNNQALQSEAPPILKALIGGMTSMLQEKLKPVPGAPPNPWAPLLQGLAQMIGQAVSKIELAKPSDATTTDAVETKVETAESKPEPKPKDPNAPLGGEGIQVELNVPLEATVQISSDSGETQAQGQSEPAPNPAAQAFFGNLMQGLGQLIQTALQPKAPAPAAPPAPAPAPAPATPEPPASTPAPAQASTPPIAEVPLQQAETPKDAPQPSIKIDVQGLLGQLLANINKPQPPKK